MRTQRISGTQFIQLFFICLALIPALSASEWKPSDLIVSENRYFEIVGHDAPSVAYVAQLSSFIAGSVLNELADVDYSNPRTVLILLDEAGTDESNLSYQVKISQLGFVNVSIQWDQKLELYSLMESLVVGFIQAYGYASFGNAYLEGSPAKAWIIHALASTAYLQLRPKLARSFYFEAEAVSFDFQLFEAELGQALPSHHISEQSFALYRWINKQPLSADEKQCIFRSALLGTSSAESLFKRIAIPTKIEFLRLWSEFLKVEQSKYQGQFMELNRSKEWLESLARFSEMKLKGIPQYTNLNAHNLWAERNSPKLRRVLEARIELISMALARINPLYYNAAQSLALTYKSLLDASYEWEVISLFSEYLDTMDRAQTVHEQISKALESPQSP
ncbi:MAG: hypothetical protein CML08_01320 [Puniceicoccaceae bacterium]|nr:hypothetical protein [Puniceicoccaceae bacterium]|tara:strand:- start:824 stop:1996 length:1173 start_codon:yes stop_codon:yes gene_type:complete